MRDGKKQPVGNNEGDHDCDQPLQSAFGYDGFAHLMFSMSDRQYMHPIGGME